MKYIAVIPARYQSCRFPGKLMKMLGKNTVIGTTYKKISSMKLFNEILIITDNKLIFNEMKNHGAKVWLSNQESPTGTDRISKIVKYLHADIIVNIQADEPFIERKELEKLLKVFYKDTKKKIQVCTLVYPLKNLCNIYNPNYVKVIIDKNNFALYFSRSPIPYYKKNQKKKNYLGHIGVYAFRKKTLIKFYNLPILTNESSENIECLRFLEHGYKIKIVKTNYKGISIDTIEDLNKARKKIINK